MERALGERFQRAALGTRTATALAGIAFLFLSLWVGGWWWMALMAAIALLAASEYAVLHRLPASLRLLSITGSVAIAVAIFVDGWPAPVILLVWALGIIFLIIWSFRGAAILTPFRPALTAAVTAPWYLAVPFAVLARWRLDLPMWSPLSFLLVIWANDTAAYFVGIAAGRHKLAPAISPGKSWEGAMAGLTAGGLVGWAASPWLGMSPLPAAVFGVVTTAASQLGDLLESAMKRRAGVKDSGTILPGHGGVLDRFDGILLAAPVAYMMVRLWGGR